jgi:nucleotide-binding universal stress UspA family protein
MSVTRKFLLIADGTQESQNAAYFAARRARNTGGGVAILAVAETDSGFEHWLGVSETMKAEAVEAAETALQSLAEDVEGVLESQPELHLREGQTLKELRNLVENDESIAILVLAASPEKSGPGPLISALGQGKALFGDRMLPVTVVPGDLSRQALKALT